MSLPETIRVKLSSEDAAALSITPVVIQELSMRELMEQVLGVAGKDEARIREILSRGTLVVGASRFRWPGWDADRSGIEALLATFPDSDPSRPFAGEFCTRAILRGPRRTIEIPRDAASQKRAFRRETFWELILQLGAAEAAYRRYSYRDRADRYLRTLTVKEAAQIRAAAERVKYRTLREQIVQAEFREVELLVVRPGG